MAQHPSRLPEVVQPLIESRGDVSRLGKYQLLRRLATGGMAEIYIARAEGMAGFEKLVVLKRILPQHAESEDFIRMFLTEARLAATPPPIWWRHAVSCSPRRLITIGSGAR